MTAGQKFRRRLKAKLIRTFDWEFWPAYIFYIPVACKIAWLSLKHFALRIPFYTNPGTINGFQAGESKAFSLGRLYEKTPDHVAQTWLIEGGSPAQKIDHVKRLLREAEIEFPVILKPDCGNRGSGVKVIHSEADVEAYFGTIEAPVIMQQFVPGPREAGVFYYRYPGQKQGQLFAITEKVFPKVTGDGKRTLEELIWMDDRAFIIADKYCDRFKDDLQTVVPEGKERQLVNAGNHAQGCIFYDGWHLATDDLTKRMDEIAKGLDEFYFGRFDVRYEKDEDLKAGRNFKILEVNGFASEATSIYDPKNSVFHAYKTLFRQWDIVFKIGAENRRRKCQAPTFGQLWARAQSYRKQKATHPVAD